MCWADLGVTLLEVTKVEGRLPGRRGRSNAKQLPSSSLMEGAVANSVQLERGNLSRRSCLSCAFCCKEVCQAMACGAKPKWLKRTLPLVPLKPGF